MHRTSCREPWRRGVNLPALARHLAATATDIAPTRLAWLACARDIAQCMGEKGREVFHTVASVWPRYSRHDSEMAYDAALRQRTAAAGSLRYIARACRARGIDIGSPRFATGHYVKTMTQAQPQKMRKMKTTPVDMRLFTAAQPSGRPIGGRCPLTDLLLRLFPEQAVLDALERYMVGFDSFVSGRMPDAITFYQIDQTYNLLNAKRIFYRPDGHRDKRYPPHLTLSDNPQCLFGLHLLAEAPPEAAIGVVESEKSAIIMSIARPHMLWMATGSLNNFNAMMLEPLRQRPVTAFPDVDSETRGGLSVSAKMWADEAARLCRRGWHIGVDLALERQVNSLQRLNKIDIADIVLEQAKTDLLKKL